jgi:hypothetical protein
MEKTYYPINEETAQEAKRAYSFFDYVKNSATNTYRAAVDRVYELVEKRKAVGDLSPEQVEKIEDYADRYARRYADWTNRYNLNMACCPSVMISGSSNFPVSKKEKQIDREGRLWEERKDIDKYLEWITKFTAGRKSTAIMSGDSDALQQLEAKLKELTEKQEKMVAYNAYYRKQMRLEKFKGLNHEEVAKIDATLEHRPYVSWMLTNNNAQIKQTRERLERLKREKTTEGREYDTTGLDIKVEEDKETMRLQVFFDGKPDAETRALLKSKAFKWAPSSGCWQRQLTNNARYAVKEMLTILKDAETE